MGWKAERVNRRTYQNWRRMRELKKRREENEGEREMPMASQLSDRHEKLKVK